MTIKQFLKKVGKSTVDELTYLDMVSYLEVNKDIDTLHYLSYVDAYWLGRLYAEGIICKTEYETGVDVLRSSVASNKRFCRIFLEAEDPTGKEDDHWEFYIEDYDD